MLATKFENIRMLDNKKISSFYYELRDIVKSSFNLEEPIPNSNVVRKILRSLLKRFIPKVTIIEEIKDIDELVGSIQTYEMTLLDSHKPKVSAFKASENEKKDIEMPYNITC